MVRTIEIFEPIILVPLVVVDILAVRDRLQQAI